MFVLQKQNIVYFIWIPESKMSESSSEKSKKGAKANASTDAAAAASGGDTTATNEKPPSPGSSEKKKKRSNLFLRVGEKIGVVEQTRIAPEFMTEIDKYFKYYEVADNLVDGIEGVVQKNPLILKSTMMEAPEKEDPYEVVSQSARAIQQMYQNEPQTFKVFGILADCFLQLGLLQRDSQLNGKLISPESWFQLNFIQCFRTSNNSEAASFCFP